MKKIILYIAQSLDGYIASKDGGVSWLPQNLNDEIAQHYESFYDTIDTIIMGAATYRQIINILSPEKWPYPNKKSYIITSNISQYQNSSECLFIDDIDMISELTKEKGKNIWLLGGAQIIDYCMRHHLIDQFIIGTVPIILGEGISLFSTIPDSIPLIQDDVIVFSDMIITTYHKK